MPETLTTLLIARGCFSALVTAFEVDAQDYAGALDASGSGGLSLLGALMQKSIKNRQSCIDAEIKAITKSLDVLIEKERVNDRDAIIADLHQFAPPLFKITRLSLQEIVTEIGADLSKIGETVAKRIPDDHKYADFRREGSVQRRFFKEIATNIYTRLLSPVDPAHALDRAIALDTHEKVSDTHDTLVDIQKMVAKLLARQENDGQLSAENPEFKNQLPETLATLSEFEGAQQQEAITALEEGDASKLEDALTERALKREQSGKADLKAAAKDWVHIGTLAYLDNTEKAHDTFNKAVSLDPENADGWNRLGHIRRRIGDLEGTKQAYETVLNLSEKSEDVMGQAIAYGNLGVLFYTRGDLDKAEEMHQKKSQNQRGTGPQRRYGHRLRQSRQPLSDPRRPRQGRGDVSKKSQNRRRTGPQRRYGQTIRQSWHPL